MPTQVVVDGKRSALLSVVGPSGGHFEARAAIPNGSQLGFLQASIVRSS